MMSAVKSVDETGGERNDVTDGEEGTVGEPAEATAEVSSGEDHGQTGSGVLNANNGVGGGTTLNIEQEGITVKPLINVDSSESDPKEIGPGDNVKISDDALSPTEGQMTTSPDESPVISRTNTSSSPTQATTSPPPSTSAKGPTNQALSRTLPPSTGANSSTASLDSVLALHSARRMRPQSPSPSSSNQPTSTSSTLAQSPITSTNAPSKSNSNAEENKAGGNQRRGVSIPSQRRFLFYWSQILSDAAPKGFWGLGIDDSKVASEPTQNELLGAVTGTEIPETKPAKESMQKVRIKGVTVRMLDPGGTKSAALKVVNKILSTTTGGKVSFKIFPLIRLFSLDDADYWGTTDL